MTLEEQEKELDKLLEVLRGAKELIELRNKNSKSKTPIGFPMSQEEIDIMSSCCRTESPAKDEQKVESHFDSFPKAYDGPNRTSKELKEMRPGRKSPEIEEWERGYRKVQKERQEIGTTFGTNVAGNGPLEKYQDKDVMKKRIKCPQCHNEFRLDHGMAVS